MKQRIWIFIFSIILCVILTGCIKKDERGKKQKVVYVVCRRRVIPVQLGKLIDEQKREAFHFTYTTGGFTYYVIGYGAAIRLRLENLVQTGHIFILIRY